MFKPTEIERWWSSQNKFLRTYEFETDTFTLIDTENNITVNNFKTGILAKKFAFDLHHDLLCATDTSYAIREKLLKYEREVAVFLGRGDLSTHVRDSLDNLRCVVRDMIDDKVWLS